MALPPAYIIEEDFSASEANNEAGRSTVDTTKLDTEFTNIKAFADAVRSSLNAVQRDDGALRDQYVTLESLSTAVLNLLAGDAVPRGAWVTATAYAVKDLAEESGITYMCVEAHTSGVFATDLAANKWIAFAGAGLSPSAVKSSYESNADTNEFSDAEQTKLAGIETAATADQTGAEIKTAYEGESDTNALTDALLTKLNGVTAGAEPNPALISQAEAEAGVSTTERTFSSVRVAQAITAQKPVATQAEAEAGVQDTKMMTPERTQQAVTEQALGVTFTADGTYTVPVGRKKLRCILISGGGGGGGGSNTASFAGGGGGGGGYLEFIKDVNPSDSVAVVVGAGGLGGAIQTGGATGGSSSIDSEETVTGGVGGTAGAGTLSGDQGNNGTASGFQTANFLLSYPVPKIGAADVATGVSNNADERDDTAGGSVGAPGADGIHVGSGGGGGLIQQVGGDGADGVVIIIPIE